MTVQPAATTETMQGNQRERSDMNVCKRGRRAAWVLALLLLSFALAGCAAQQGAPSQPGAAGAAGGAKGQAGAAGAQAASSAQGAGAQAGAHEAQRMGAERTPLGDRVEIRKSWVQVRSKPSPDAPAIALAFGNDTFPVLERKGDWVRVRLDGKREGWIPVDAAQP
jgi:uncharacterized protein YgiM (DUF1202 family)